MEDHSFSKVRKTNYIFVKTNFFHHPEKLSIFRLYALKNQPKNTSLNSQKMSMWLLGARLQFWAANTTTNNSTAR